ncbi:patatin-like phospholipase family protein [Enterovirga sp.]|jgi:NTE family protein|uniref:patatin-like phospholipase family protein n=1 Tax=Enterovirga sp. TaxID=2026350 RepID=UPI0026027101|nr:patatin-like phospholipase family protein [Enterovirga sp.]MDB5592773.1 family protein rssA [Enterovirga sp.]
MLFDGFSRLAFGNAPEGRTGSPAAPAPEHRKLRLGLALGAGAARGWAHIGILRVLDEAGLRPDVIAGCSIGAVVGGCFAAGKLDPLEAFARTLTKRRIMGLLDFHITGSGLIGGDRLRKLLDVDLGPQRIEDLPIRFATVATEFGSGHEIWLTRGPLVESLGASYALPGIFDPVRVGGRWLMDGALVNPVPVTVARALGADLVVCVNLNGEIRLRGTVIQAPAEDEPAEAGQGETDARGLFGGGSRRRSGAPGMAAVMIDAFNITQDRISRSRLAGDPPDVMIAPKLQSVGLFEFHRAAECIDKGAEAATRILPDLRDVLGAVASAVQTGTPQAVAM